MLPFGKTLDNICDQFGPHHQDMGSIASKKKKRRCDNSSHASTKTTRNARAVSHYAETSPSQQSTKCTPLPVNSVDESNTENAGASSHSLVPSSPPNKNSVHPHPPDLIDEEEPKEIRHLVVEKPKSSTAPPSLPPRCTISSQLVAAVAVLEAP